MQSLAPKHQKLIKRCYPPGREIDKKPNASELSYLLYYVSTRRIKLGKVALFLEAKATRDVARNRSGNVQVTLDITRALIERVHDDLNVFAPNVVNIILTALSSNDLALCRRAGSVWATFCQYHDGALFAGDDGFYQSFRRLVKTYVEIGSTLRKGPNARQWQAVGIGAASALAVSPALATTAGQREVDEIVPMLLNALESKDLDALSPDMEKYFSGPLDELSESNAGDASESDAEGNGARVGADHVAAMAAASLRRLFDSSTGMRVRRAASAIAKWILGREAAATATSVPATELPPTPDSNGLPAIPTRAHGHRLRGSHMASNEAPVTSPPAPPPKPSTLWSTTILVTCASWTPVHLRFVIVSALMEVLLKLHIEQVSEQMTVVRLITALLSSQVTMVGLAVVDVLQALHGRQHAVIQAAASSGTESPRLEAGKLVVALRDCIASLATHMYYADQVQDMVSEVLSRAVHASSASLTVATDQRSLNSPTAGPSRDGIPGAPPLPTSKTGISLKSAAAKAIVDSGSRPEAIVVNDLRNVQQIINVAADKSSAGRESLSIPLSVWVGTQNLLNHESSNVIIEYVIAFAHYLDKGSSARMLQQQAATRRKSVAGIERVPTAATDDDGGPALRRIVQGVCTSAMEPTSRSTKYISIYYLLVMLIQYFSDSEEHIMHSIMPWILSLQDFGVQVEHDAYHQGHTAEQGVALSSMSLALLGIVAQALQKNDLYAAISNEISARKRAVIWSDGFELPLHSSLQQLLAESRRLNRPIDNNAARHSVAFSRDTVASYFDIPADSKAAIFHNSPQTDDSSASGDNSSAGYRPHSSRQPSKRATSYAALSNISQSDTNGDASVGVFMNRRVSAASSFLPLAGYSELAPRVNDLKRVASSQRDLATPRTATGLSPKSGSLYSAKSTVSTSRQEKDHGDATPVADGDGRFVPAPGTAAQVSTAQDVNDFLSSLSISTHGRVI